MPKQTQIRHRHEIRKLGTVVGLIQAGQFFGLGIDASRAAERDGTFPVKTMRVGRRVFVSQYEIAKALGVNLDAPAPAEETEDDTGEATDDDVDDLVRAARAP